MELVRTTIDKLIPWAENPREIDVEDMERLKRQILEFKQYKPLVCRPAGELYEVLGGNMRFEALRELVAEKRVADDIWISVVYPEDEAQALKYAISDNDQVGAYDEAKLAKLILPVAAEIALEDYRISVGKQADLSDLLSKYGPAMDVNQVELDENIKTTYACQECGYRW